jgi:hypothetical protein
MRVFASGLLCVFAASASLQAYDFSAADGLFADRGAGPQSAALATQAYMEALGQTSGEEKIYAAVQIGRLASLQGVMYEGQIPLDVRKKVLESCIDSMNTIKSSRQEYYYFSLTCIGARGKLASNLFDKFHYARMLSGMEAAALKSTQDVNGRYVGGFEAGGILRVMAAVYGNPQAHAVGLYNPQKAFDFASAAVESGGGTYPPFKEFLSGKTYWDNYYYLGQAMVSLALKTENRGLVIQGAQKLLSTLDVIQEKEDDLSLSKERQPEVAYYRTMMQKLADQVDICLKATDWISCLKKAMGE